MFRLIHRYISNSYEDAEASSSFWAMAWHILKFILICSGVGSVIMGGILGIIVLIVKCTWILFIVAAFAIGIFVLSFTSES